MINYGIDGDSVIEYKINGKRYVERISEAWFYLSTLFSINKENDIEYINLKNIEIFDCEKQKYIITNKIYKGFYDNWHFLTFEDGRIAIGLNITDNAYINTINKGKIPACSLNKNDNIISTRNIPSSLVKDVPYKEHKNYFYFKTETGHFEANGLNL